MVCSSHRFFKGLSENYAGREKALNPPGMDATLTVSYHPCGRL